MEKLDKKKLQKLSPAERLKKLREIEEAGKKELKEAESLIEQTLAEIKGPSSEGGSAPATDISQLFGGAEENLEGAVQSESKAEEGGGEVKYSAVTYSTDYKAFSMEPPKSEGKVEDTVKYEGATEQNVKSTATKTDIESMKKYSKG